MSSFCFHSDFCIKKSQKPLWALGFYRRHLFRSAIMAGAQGFEPRKCQSQSLMPYRLAMPHNNMIYYNHFQVFCQAFFEKISSFFRLFSPRTPVFPLKIKAAAAVLPDCAAVHPSSARTDRYSPCRPRCVNSKPRRHHCRPPCGGRAPAYSSGYTAR